MAQVDPQTFATNLALIVGGVVVLTGLFFATLALITGARCLLWMYQMRRAEEEHRRMTRRADGELYPPQIEGQCSRCKRGDRKIYMAGGGNELCPRCYERHWRAVEGWVDGDGEGASTSVSSEVAEK